MIRGALPVLGLCLLQAARGFESHFPAEVESLDDIDTNLIRRRLRIASDGFDSDSVEPVESSEEGFESESASEECQAPEDSQDTEEQAGNEEKAASGFLTPPDDYNQVVAAANVGGFANPLRPNGEEDPPADGEEDPPASGEEDPPASGAEDPPAGAADPHFQEGNVRRRLKGVNRGGGNMFRGKNKGSSPAEKRRAKKKLNKYLHGVQAQKRKVAAIQRQEGALRKQLKQAKEANQPASVTKGIARQLRKATSVRRQGQAYVKNVGGSLHKAKATLGNGKQNNVANSRDMKKVKHVLKKAKRPTNAKNSLLSRGVKKVKTFIASGVKHLVSQAGGPSPGKRRV